MQKKRLKRDTEFIKVYKKITKHPVIRHDWKYAKFLEERRLFRTIEDRKKNWVAYVLSR